MSAETSHRAMIRISRDLLDQLGELAKRNERSVTAELRLIVKAHLRANGIEPAEMVDRRRRVTA